MSNPLAIIIGAVFFTALALFWLLEDDFKRCESEEEKKILYRTAAKVGRERVKG